MGLLPTAYSPFLVETMVRLGTRLPFAQAADELALLFGVSVSADTVRRLTEQAGAIQVGIEQQELEHLEHEAPLEAATPTLQQVSTDGVMVPVVGGGWTEARTIVIGTVEERAGAPHATNLSYFARHCSADAFIRWTTLPTHERSTRRAQTVLAISDGAPWIQELIDEQCPQAIRILDFPHAVGYLARAAQAVWGAGSREASVWLEVWVPKLKAGDPAEVVTAIRNLPTPNEEAKTAKRTALRYLNARSEQIQYARFRKAGYPIGSGIAESACKLVVEERLKGSGMHWAATNLTPLLALRGRLCSKQWTETWRGIWQAWRSQVTAQREVGWRRRAAERAAKRAAALPPPPEPEPAREREKTIVNGKPTKDHPWKRESPHRAA